MMNSRRAAPPGSLTRATLPFQGRDELRGDAQKNDSISIRGDARNALHPRTRGLRLLLVAADLVGLDHGFADIVEAVEQRVLARRVDVERHTAAVGAADFLLLQIDRERRIGAATRIVEQLVEIFLRDADRQNAVLE